MKRMIACLAAAAALLAGAQIASAYADAECTYLGDFDGDQAVGVTDLVWLQRYLLGMLELPDEQAAARADMTQDGTVDIFDMGRLRQCVLSGEWLTAPEGTTTAETYDQNPGPDLTVPAAYRFQPTQRIIRPVTQTGAFPAQLSANWQTSADAADVIYFGSFGGYAYTLAEQDGKVVPYTVYDCGIMSYGGYGEPEKENVLFKGDLPPKSRITIYEPGGYFLLTDYLKYYPEMEPYYAEYSEEEKAEITLDFCIHKKDGLPEALNGWLWFVKAADGTNGIPAGAYTYAYDLESCVFLNPEDYGKSELPYRHLGTEQALFTRAALKEYLGGEIEYPVID